MTNETKWVCFVCAFAFNLFFTLATVARAESPPTRGLVLWLDAEDIDADGKVSNNPQAGHPIRKWADKSGQGNHVEQEIAEQRPTFEPAAVGGKPVVRFHGKDALRKSIAHGLSAGDQPFHVFFVMQATATAPHTNPRPLGLQ